MSKIETQLPSENPALGGKEMIEAYRQMLVSLFLSTLSIVLLMAIGSFIIFGVFLQDNDLADPPILIAVLLAGILGSLFSALTRLYNLKDLPKVLLHHDLRKLRNKYLLIYSLVPLIMGFVASGLIYFAVMAQIIDGVFFPTFTCKIPENLGTDCNSFKGLFHFAPETAGDYAKAIVIGFISGFSERLVKNVLGNVESSSQNSK